MQWRLRPSSRSSNIGRHLPSPFRNSVTIPFTVKFRLGWNDSSRLSASNSPGWPKPEGLNGVALHARTREQGYSGQARWGWIAAIKDAANILPVIGNGDIRTP